jgi:lysophospholipase L1-like esterase
VGGGIPEGQTVYVDYDYGPDRLDSLVLTAAKEASLRQGNSSLPLVNPTEYVLKDEVVLANVFVPGRCVALTDENLYPIHYRTGRPPAKHSDAAEKLLPKTLAKLRSGEPLTYIAWGDSVTNGGGVGAHKEQWYQTMFVNELKTRFPKANITLITAAWPGGNSSGYMSAPSGGPYVYQRDVLDPKPDLVSIEFVNDAGLDEASVQAHYGQILADLRGVGAETILITPHLVRPDWMNCTTLKFDEDPRPYVRGLRQFAATNNVALADASRLWCLLYRQGIPYTKILANDINHPDVRGHQLFVDALMALFPAR